MTASPVAAAAHDAGTESGAYSGAALWNRLGAISGILFVVLTFIGFSLDADTTADVEPGQPSATIARLLEENQDDGRLGASLFLLAIFFLIWFVTIIYRRLLQAEAGPSGLAFIALGGGLVTASALLILLYTDVAFMSISDYGDDTQVAKTLVALTWEGVAVLGAPMAALVGATSIASWLYRAFPRWLAVLGIPVTAALLIFPIVFLGMLLFFIWALIVAVVILVRPVLPGYSAVRAS